MTIAILKSRGARMEVKLNSLITKTAQNLRYSFQNMAKLFKIPLVSFDFN